MFRSLFVGLCAALYSLFSFGQVAQFTSASGILNVPVVQIDGGTYYTNVQISLPSSGPWNVVSSGVSGTSLALLQYPNNVYPMTGTIANFTGVSPGTPLVIATTGFGQQLWVASTCNLSSQFAVGLQSVTIYRTGEAQFQLVIDTTDSCSVIPFVNFAGPVTTPTSTSVPLVVSPTAISSSVNSEIPVTVSGGTAPYQILSTQDSLVTVNAFTRVGNLNQTIGTVTLGKVTGAAALVVSDTGGQIVRVPVTISASASTASSLAVSPTAVSAAAGSDIPLTVSGGTPPYQVLSTQTSLVKTGTFTQVGTLAQAIGTITLGTTAGSAEIVLTDAGGQVVRVPVTITSTANPLTASPSTISSSSGSAISVTVSGGTPPYQVLSTQTSVVSVGTFAQIGSLAQAIGTATLGTTAGSAEIVISDAGGKVLRVPVTVNPTSSSPLTASPSTIAASGGSTISVTLNGGTPPYQAFSTQTALASVGTFTQIGSLSQAIGTVTLGSTAGSAEIVLSDAGGQVVRIPVTVVSGGGAMAVVPGSATFKASQSGTFLIQGGRPPYQVTSSSNVVGFRSVTTTSASSGSFIVITSLGMTGTGTLTVTDSVGGTVSITVTVN